MYSSVFLVDYLMNDEMARIGIRRSLSGNVEALFLTVGRGLEGVTRTLLYDFVGYSPERLRLVRLLNFVSIAASAAVLLSLLEKRWRGPAMIPLLAVVFLYSQRWAQGLMGYSLVSLSQMQPAIWLSLIAFHLHFSVFSGRGRRVALEWLAIVACFCAALQFSQAFAFFSMILVVNVALCDWSEYRGRVWSFLALAGVSVAASFIVLAVTLAVLHGQGAEGYRGAEAAVGAVTESPVTLLRSAINPVRYWSAFQLWTYPFPFDRLLPSVEGRRLAATVIMLLWATLVACVMRIEKTYAKWVAAGACCLVGMGWLLADSPGVLADHRPHVMAHLTGVVIMSGAYALSVLAARSTVVRRLAPVGLVCVLATAVGAQSNLLSAIVLPRSTELRFLRTELAAKPADAYRRIIVIPPGEPSPCIAPPCAPWMGAVVSGRWHATRTPRYRFVLSLIGVPPDSKTIEISEQEPSPAPADAIVVNWPRFVEQSLEQARARTMP
jgi:hypothetical protein